MSHPLHLAFVWHMHQPYYRDLATGECSMPWVRLHGTKDYLDMVTLLEEFPAIHQTVNVVPSLLDQLEAYLPPTNRSDYFLDLSRKPAGALTEAEQQFILQWFFMANWQRMVAPHACYHRLLLKRGTSVPEEAWPAAAKRFTPQDYLDLQVWFNLVWIDPWLRQQDPKLKALEAKDGQFTEADKHLVLDTQLELLARILPAYRAAQARGQIELTTSPYYHPIIPLLCDLQSAHVALPQLRLPEEAFQHPEDARWHLTQALERHAGAFGKAPTGLWPSEGSVSDALVSLALEAGFRWIATDEELLWKTLKTSRSPALLYRPHTVRREGKSLAVVFRDQELSDRIGFVYSQWNAAQAVRDFMERLERIHEQCQDSPTPALVSIILDGENAWEGYPDDGHEFLRTLYDALAHDARFRAVTVQEFLDRYPLDRDAPLSTVFAGSWIDGNFSTWIGHPEKNAAWTFLATTRQDLLEHTARPAGEGSDAVEQAWRSFYLAEGSDWMWWYGDTHSSAQDAEFDRLFRTHLMNVYRFLGLPHPAELNEPIKPHAVQPAYEPTAVLTPTIDGCETTYYEWLYAGRLDLRKSYGAIHRSGQILQALLYGFDERHAYFRVDVAGEPLARLSQWQLQFEIPDRRLEWSVRRTSSGAVEAPSPIRCAYRHLLEIAVPISWMAVKPGETFQLRLLLSGKGQALESYPAHGAFRMRMPAEDFEATTWSV